MPVEELDPQLATALQAPRSLSYSCEYAVAAGAGSAVLAPLFPKEAQRFAEAARYRGWAQDFGESRIASVGLDTVVVGGLTLTQVVAALRLSLPSSSLRYPVCCEAADRQIERR